MFVLQFRVGYRARIGYPSVLVTFRFRGEAQSVKLRGSLEALGDTELRRQDGEWALSLDLPSDTRVVYWFGLDGEDDWKRWVPDPANPNRYVYPAGLEFTREDDVVGSLLELPDARAWRWSVEREVPRGEVVEREVDGRRLWLYTPAAEPSARLLLFDGHQYKTLAATPVVLDNLIADGLIPPTGAVLVDTLDTESRWRDLQLNPDFLRWSTEVLLPASGFESPPQRTVVAGSSLGGLAATYFAVQRPDLFGNALVQAGWFPEEIPSGQPIRWYVDVGRFDGMTGEGTRALRDSLRAAGYDVAYQEYSGGHDFFWWRETLADGLIALLGSSGGAAKMPW
jgi:enterochelin esterase-like enzyme